MGLTYLLGAQNTQYRAVNERDRKHYPLGTLFQTINNINENNIRQVCGICTTMEKRKTEKGGKEYGGMYPFLGFSSGSAIIYLQCGSRRRLGFYPWVGKIPWRRAWQSTPVFLPGESPWTEEPGGLQSMGLQKSWTQQKRLSTCTCPFLSCWSLRS